jgi:hypothetical protein
VAIGERVSVRSFSALSVSRAFWRSFSKEQHVFDTQPFRFGRLQLNMLLWNVIVTDKPRAAAEAQARGGATSNLAA